MKQIENLNPTRQICYYLRNSTEHQEYIFQREALDKHFNTLKNVNLYGEFAEKISGFTNEKLRPKMNELLELVRSNTIDNLEIWVYDVARLSRESINLLQIVKDCTEYQVNIYFLSNNVQTLNPDKKENHSTKILLGILAQFAESDAKQLKLKMRYGKETKSKTGTQYIGGVIPTGYDYNNNLINKTKDLFVDDNRRKVVEYVFDEYVNGKSMNQIANQLNILKNVDNNFITEFKYRKKKSNTDNKHDRWTQSTVKSLLDCTWYIGKKTLSNGDIVILPDYLKIIDESIWNKSQSNLSLNKNRSTERKHTWLLKDLMYCECGNKMTLHHICRDKVTTGNYICMGELQKKYDSTLCCTHNSKSIKAENLDSAVWLLVKNKLDEFKLQVQEVNNKETEIEKEIQKLNDFISSIINFELKELEVQKNRAIDSFIRFNVNVDDKVKDIDNQISNLNKMVIDKKKEIEVLKLNVQNLDIVSEIENNILIIEKDKTLIRSYLNKLVDKIIVHSFNKFTFSTLVEIIWKSNVKTENTFLFYNRMKTKNVDDNKYYYVSNNGSIKVNWNYKISEFEINDNGIYSTSTINEMIEIFNVFNDISDEFDIEMDKVLKEFNVDDRDISTNRIDIGSGELKIVVPFN